MGGQINTNSTTGPPDCLVARQVMAITRLRLGAATLSNGANLSNLFDVNLTTSCQQSTNGTAASITNFGPLTVNSTVAFYSVDGDAR